MDNQLLPTEPKTTFNIGPAKFYVLKSMVVHNGQKIFLTPYQNRLLQSIAAAEGNVVEKDAVYGDYCSPTRRKPEPKTIDVQVSKLRKQLGDLGDYIVTIWGRGYQLASEPGSRKHTGRRTDQWKRGITKRMRGVYTSIATA